MPRNPESTAKSITQGVVGNAIFQLVWSGVAMLGTWFAAHTATLRGWALPWVILLASTVFLLLTLTMARIQLWMGQRRSLRVQQEGCPQTWLHDIAKEDRRKADSLVRVEQYHMGNGGLGLIEEPFLNFGFDIFNGAVYHISIERKVEGYIALGLRRIRGEVEMRTEILQNLKHGEVGHIGLRQNLTKEDVELIKNRNNPGAEDFAYDHLVITITGGDDYKDVAPKVLVFSRPSIIR